MSDPSGPSGRIEVAMLLAPPEENRRVAAALHRAGYRPVVPTDVLDWAARQEHTLVLITDSDRSLALLRGVIDAGADPRAVVLARTPGADRYRSLLRHCTAALPAGSPDADIVAAVRAAHRALSCLPRTAVSALTGALEEQPPALTDTERVWLRALADNVTVATLARASGYSQREMYRLLAEVYRRLGVATRTEALLRADRLGLLHTPAGMLRQPRHLAPTAPRGRLTG